MNDNPLERRAVLWSEYWASGAAHSLGASPTGYTGGIATFWHGFFTGLTPDAVVLDIATGNGPLPRLMVDTPGREDLRCDAVDLAQVAPPWLTQAEPARRARVRFHPGVDAAALPFEAARFDAVISQWGLEYTALARSVPELLRVLKPGGAVGLVVHHAEGRPVRLAREELAHLGWLQAPDGVLEAARAVLPLLARARTPEGRAALRADPSAAACRERYNAAMDALDARAAASSCPDVLNEVAERLGALLAMAGAGGEAGAVQALDQWTLAQRDAALRLSELVDHALDEAGARALARSLSGVDTEPPRWRLGELRAEDALMGWTIVLEPQALISPAP